MTKDEQKCLPVYSKDHHCFKRIALKENTNMKELFHRWVEEKKILYGVKT